MARPSTIKRLPADQRRFLERLIREDRYTLDEILAHVRQKFPAAVVPSRSALGRYSQQVNVLAGRMRDIQAAGTALVAELGEDPNDRAGQLLVQAVTTLATHAALKATDDDTDDLSIKEIGQLARAAHATMQSRKLSLAERQEIARVAREELVREQRAKLDELGKTGAVDPAVLAQVVKAAYDL